MADSIKDAGMPGSDSDPTTNPIPKFIPKRFVERYGSIVDDPDAFFAALAKPVPKSFRVNTIKSNREEVMERFASYGIDIRQTPWYDDAFVTDNLDIGMSLEHFLGFIYIQELTSMLPPLVARNELSRANLVLDGCAAPGSKTTQIAAMMGNRGVIYANDSDYSRIRALKFNLEKTGVLNTVITNMGLQKYPPRQFDCVFIDAPCSSEGTCRKNDKIFFTWDEGYIAKNAEMQKKLILKGFDLLAPGGMMIYSTCTFAPEENEAVLDYLLCQREDAKIEKVVIPGLKTAKGITSFAGVDFDSSVKDCIRIWPHHNDTDGFFLAGVRK